MDKNLSKILGFIGEIPPMPHVATQVIKLVGDPNSSSHDLHKIISADEGISSKVLKMANSAFFGCMNSIKSVKQAIIIIGFNTIKSLVIASSTSSLYKKKNGEQNSISKKLWEHSIGCSIASRLIAQKIGKIQPDEAFTGGLLHDIGRLIINQKFNDQFKKITEIANETKSPLIISEKETLSFNHTEIGLFLSEKWKLPTTLKDIISLHHEPAKSVENKNITAVIGLADSICVKKGIGVQINDELDLEKQEAALILGLKNSDFQPLIVKFLSLLEEEMSLFNL